MAATPQECLDNITRLLAENSRSAFRASGLVFGSKNTANNLKWLLVGFDFEHGSQFPRNGPADGVGDGRGVGAGQGKAGVSHCSLLSNKVRALPPRGFFLPGD